MKKSRLKILFINLVTIIVILGIAEIVSRVVLRRIYNRSFDSGLIANNRYLSSPGLKENIETTVWGKQFSTDAEGRRKTKNNNPTKTSWLYIGDSVTEGVGVDDSSTFVSLCSEKFTEFNVYNYSLIGYSSSDYVNVLSTLLAKDSSIQLVTLVYCLNDVYGNSKTSDLPAIAKQNIIGKLNGILQSNSAAYKLIKLFFYRNSNHYFTYDLQFYKKDDPHFIKAMSDLHTCDSLCKARNIYFNITMLPYRSQLKDRNFEPQRLVYDFCEKNRIDLWDAREHLDKARDFDSLYLFADEIHFSEKGHRAIADFLSE